MKGLLDDFGPIDVIVGADVVLWPQHVEELLITIKLLLLASSAASFSTYLNIISFEMIFLHEIVERIVKIEGRLVSVSLAT